MFTRTQTTQLLKGLNPSRVEKRAQAGITLSYLAQQDVRAHLIRMFGFGGFDLKTLEANVVSIDEVNGKWEACCQVTMELTVRDPYGDTVCVYSETAIGTNTQGRKGEALDMAMKSASSDAMKRCATNLGDQFGLSLYSHGQVAPIVRGVLVNSPDSDGDEVGVEDMPAGANPNGADDE